MPQRAFNVGGFTTPGVADSAEPPDPLFGEVVHSAFELNNDALNVYRYLSRPAFKDVANYDIFAKLKGSKYNDDYFHNFVDVRSDEEFNFVASKIDQEQKDRDVLSRAGWGGTVAAIGAQVISPTLFIPLTAGGQGLKMVAEAALLGLGGAAAQEIPLRLNQETRTNRDTIESLAAGTILGGMLGGASAMLSKAERSALEADMVGSSIQPAIPRAVGAASTPSADPGRLAKGTRWITTALDITPITRSPVTDTIEGGVVPMRIVMAGLDDAGLTMEKNALFIPTSEGGTVSNNVTPWYGKYADWAGDADSAYARYVFDKTPPTVMPNLRARIQAYQVGKMSRGDFNKAVADALWSGDTHVNKFVEEVAKSARKKLLDPILDAMQKTKMLGDELPESADLSYLGWLPNHEAITKDPVRFVDFLEKKFNVKLQEQFNTMWEKHQLKNAQDEEFLTDMGRQQKDIDQLRDQLGLQLKGVEDRMEAQQFDVLSDTIANLRAMARPLKDGSLQDEVIRKQMLKDARDMEEQAGPVFKANKEERRAIKKRLSQLNKATAVVEERLANKLDKIERAEDLSEGGLMRVARKGQKILNELENWTDEKLDAEVSKLKDDFERAANIYDRGEERVKKLAEGDPIFEPTYTSAGIVPEQAGARPFTPEGLEEYKKELVAGFSGDLPKKVSASLAKATDDTGWKKFLGDFNKWVAGRKQPPTDLIAKVTNADNELSRFAQEINTRAEAGIKEEARQRIRSEKLTDVSERLADAEDLGRDAMRSLITDMLDATITRVREINDRRAVRTAKLREQVKNLTPEAQAERLAAFKEKGRVRQIDLSDRVRKLGDPDFDPSVGKADFTKMAREQAYLTKDKFLGTMLRLPLIDMIQAERGAALPRMLSFIPSKEMAPWLEQDVEKILRHHLRTMAPDIEISKKFGDVQASEWLGTNGHAQTWFNDQLEAIDKSKSLTPEKKAKMTANLTAEFAKAKENVIVTMKRLRHQHGIPSNPDGMAARMAKLISDVNVLRYMGGVTLTSIPDLGRPIARYGLTRAFKDGFIPYITNMKSIQISKREARLAGVGNEVAFAARAHALVDVMDDLGRGSKFERAVSYASGKQGIVALFSHWTDAMKYISSGTAIGRIMDEVAEVMTNAKPSVRTVEFLASNGVDANGAEKIWKEIQGGGGQKVNDSWLPNTEDWKDPETVQLFRQALAREVNNTITTPGLERPAWMTATITGRLIAQFRSFAFSSTYKTLGAGLQQRDANFVIGSTASLALGAMSYFLYAKARGGKIEQDMMNASPERWADEAWARAGLDGTFGLGRDVLSRIPATAPFVSLSGGRTTRRGGDDLVEALGGPTFDAITKVAQILSGLDDPTAATTHVGRQLLPYQNYTFLSRGYDAIEHWVNSAFSIPEDRR